MLKRVKSAVDLGLKTSVSLIRLAVLKAKQAAQWLKKWLKRKLGRQE